MDLRESEGTAQRVWGRGRDFSDPRWSSERSEQVVEICAAPRS